MTQKKTKVPHLGEWADTVTARDFDPAWIDLYALQQYDHVLRALGWRGTFRTNVRAEDRERPMDRHSLAIFVFMILLPVVGVTAFGGSDLATHTTFEGLDAGVGVPVVASAFTLSLPGPVLELRRCLLRRGDLTYLEVAGFGVTLVASTLSLIGLTRIWDVDVLHLQVASVPVWASLVLAATALCVITLITHRRGPSAPAHFRRSGDADPERARELLDRLASGERGHLAQARGRAISTLRDRGLLTLEQAVQLSDLPLGGSMSLRDTRRRAS
jgi:hypothetical protein